MSKEQYKYEWQLISIMHDNYGISLDDFTKLVHEQYKAVPYHDITSTHERISAKKLYHVIETDNYDGDYPDESFITYTDEKGKTRIFTFDIKDKAQSIATAFNNLTPENSPRFFKVVEKNYKLSGPFEP